MDEKPEKLEEVWDKEIIRSSAALFCYVHKSAVNKKDKIPYERAFRNTPFEEGTNLSSDWDKYSTAEATRLLLARQPKNGGEFKNPEDYYVVKLNVGEILEKIPTQQIEHDPIQNQPPLPDNRAHSIIIGEKNEKARLTFVDICEWAIAPPGEFYL